MKRLVWEFLNMKYSDIVIYRQVHFSTDKRMELFVTDRGNRLIEFSYFYSGKETRTRVNSFIRRDIRNLFDIHEIDIEMYVLEWCRDKAVDYNLSTTDVYNFGTDYSVNE